MGNTESCPLEKGQLVYRKLKVESNRAKKIIQVFLPELDPVPGQQGGIVVRVRKSTWTDTGEYDFTSNKGAGIIGVFSKRGFEGLKSRPFCAKVTGISKSGTVVFLQPQELSWEWFLKRLARLQEYADTLRYRIIGPA